MNWELLPDGINAGDSFRLLFVTSSKRKANSSAIGDYNDFVRPAAQRGHVRLSRYCAQFKQMACTRAVDARDNIDTTTSGTSNEHQADTVENHHRNRACNMQHHGKRRYA